MVDRVVLHIGTMKSGASFVQAALTANREVLRDSGHLFLGGSFGRQTRAVREVLAEGGTRKGLAQWTALAEEARAFPGEAGIVSMEQLSFARRAQVAAFLEPLAGLEVDVLLTVRDQFRAIPAQWETSTRSFGTDSWATYLQRLRSRTPDDRRSRAFETFTRAQDVPTMVERWRSHPGVNQVVVVTVPEPEAPREELWARFCAVVGIPADDLSLGDLQARPGLGYASSELLRRMNLHLGDVAPRAYRRGVRALTRSVLDSLRELESRPLLDVAAAEHARELNRAIRASLTEYAVPVIGSRDELPLPDDVSDHPDEVPAPLEAGVRRAAEAAWDHLAEALGIIADERPTDLDRLVDDTAALLRRVNKW